jgi:hypothetical protein
MKGVPPVPPDSQGFWFGPPPRAPLYPSDYPTKSVEDCGRILREGWPPDPSPPATRQNSVKSRRAWKIAWADEWRKPRDSSWSGPPSPTRSPGSDPLPPWLAVEWTYVWRRRLAAASYRTVARVEKTNPSVAATPWGSWFSASSSPSVVVPLALSVGSGVVVGAGRSVGTG